MKAGDRTSGTIPGGLPGPTDEITAEHVRVVLEPRGITLETAKRAGVRSLLTDADLPEGCPDYWTTANGYLPGLLFTYRSPDGTTTVPQLRPDVPVTGRDGDVKKYVFAKDALSILHTAKTGGEGSLLIVEGTCQALAAAAYAPAGVDVFGIAGCRSWMKKGLPTRDLEVVAGRDVLIALDADAATNLEVFQAGVALREACLDEGASSVRFIRTPGGRNSGLDDVLGGKDEGKRSALLANLIERAITRPRAEKPEQPAKVKPDPKKAPARTIAADRDRPRIEVNGDRQAVIRDLLMALKRWDGSRLFMFGGVLAELRGTSVFPVVRDRLNLLISDAALTVSVSAKGDESFTWPDGQTAGAILASAEEFTELDRISRTPFVRPDGSICQTSGYDPATRTFAALDELDGLDVPDEPTVEDVAGALKLLTDEWLGDFMAIMPSDADRANLLALVLTPLIRGQVELTPLFVIDGLQMGVGKNLLADLVSILHTGRPAQPLPYSRDDDETRKVITSAFRSGAEQFVFDEAHVIEGPSLARAVTAVTYSDRVLGVSTMAEFPNRITWVALGNNVRVNGDMVRRVVRIRLAPTVANPQDRDSKSFRHPDIRAWTTESRAELLAAALTLVRAWHVAGRPALGTPVSLGSFERWTEVVGGVLSFAGVDGFLGNLLEWRSESDFDRQHWSEHLLWLLTTFGERVPFTAAEATRKLAGRDAEPPPGMEDPTGSGYSRRLGQAYGAKRDQSIDGFILRKLPNKRHGNVVRWHVETTPEGPRGPDGPPARFPKWPPAVGPVTAATPTFEAPAALQCPSPVCDAELTLDRHHGVIDAVCPDPECRVTFAVDAPWLHECRTCGALALGHCRFDGREQPGAFHPNRVFRAARAALTRGAWSCVPADYLAAA